jgi:hypothetical protein
VLIVSFAAEQCDPKNHSTIQLEFSKVNPFSKKKIVLFSKRGNKVFKNNYQITFKGLFDFKIDVAEDEFVLIAVDVVVVVIVVVAIVDESNGLFSSSSSSSLSSIMGNDSSSNEINGAIGVVVVAADDTVVSFVDKDDVVKVDGVDDTFASTIFVNLFRKSEANM